MESYEMSFKDFSTSKKASKPGVSTDKPAVQPAKPEGKPAAEVPPAK